MDVKEETSWSQAKCLKIGNQLKLKCILKAADHAAIKENEADLYTLMWKHLQVILMREKGKVEQTIKKRCLYICLFIHKNFWKDS